MAKNKNSKKKSAAKKNQNTVSDKKKQTPVKKSTDPVESLSVNNSDNQKKNRGDKLRPQFLIIYLLIAILLSYGLISVKEKKDYARNHPSTSETSTSAVSTTKKNAVKDSGLTTRTEIYDDWKEPTSEATTDILDEEVTTKKIEEFSTTNSHTETGTSEAASDVTESTEQDTTEEKSTEEELSTDPIPSEKPTTE